MKINISSPRVGIEPTTSRFYNHTLCLCATTGLKLPSSTAARWAKKLKLEGTSKEDSIVLRAPSCTPLIEDNKKIVEEINLLTDRSKSDYQACN